MNYMFMLTQKFYFGNIFLHFFLFFHRKIRHSSSLEPLGPGLFGSFCRAEPKSPGPNGSQSL